MLTLKHALAATVLTLGLASVPPAALAEEAAVEQAENGGLVLFLSQTDSMLAGHALHIANRMLAEERSVTIVLVGDGGQLALKHAVTSASSFSGRPLQDELAAFIEAGGTVAITPPTIASMGGDLDALIEGVGPPEDHMALHDFMFEPRTKLMVF